VGAHHRRARTDNHHPEPGPRAGPRKDLTMETKKLMEMFDDPHPCSGCTKPTRRPRSRSGA
jgi:hypothetical protein